MKRIGRGLMMTIFLPWSFATSDYWNVAGMAGEEIEEMTVWDRCLCIFMGTVVVFGLAVVLGIPVIVLTRNAILYVGLTGGAFLLGILQGLAGCTYYYLRKRRIA